MAPSPSPTLPADARRDPSAATPHPHPEADRRPRPDRPKLDRHDHDRDRLLTRHEAAEALSCSPLTLAKWSHEGRGPALIRVGRSVRYRRADLLDYLDARRVEHADGVEGLPSTSPAAAAVRKGGDHADR